LHIQKLIARKYSHTLSLTEQHTTHLLPLITPGSRSMDVREKKK